jgi:hypothetical protein
MNVGLRLQFEAASRLYPEGKNVIRLKKKAAERRASPTESGGTRDE